MTGCDTDAQLSDGDPLRTSVSRFFINRLCDAYVNEPRSSRLVLTFIVSVKNGVGVPAQHPRLENLWIMSERSLQHRILIRAENPISSNRALCLVSVKIVDVVPGCLLRLTACACSVPDELAMSKLHITSPTP